MDAAPPVSPSPAYSPPRQASPAPAHHQDDAPNVPQAPSVSPLRQQIAAEFAALERLKARKGRVTRAMVSEALPPFLRAQASPAIELAIAQAINAALDAAADPVGCAPALDHQARAAGAES